MTDLPAALSVMFRAAVSLTAKRLSHDPEAVRLCREEIARRDAEMLRGER